MTRSGTGELLTAVPFTPPAEPAPVVDGNAELRAQVAALTARLDRLMAALQG